MNKWSVIMPVYTGQYPGCGTKLDEKFVRAVESFLRQDYPSKELVIVADGVSNAINLWHHYFATKDEVVFLKIPKKVPRTGIIRNLGMQIASGNRICYLDADDILAKRHLSNLDIRFMDDVDWVWFEDCIASRVNSIDDYEYRVRPGVRLERHKIGTGCIAHKKGLDVTWGDTYSDDWKLIQDLMK